MESRETEMNACLNTFYRVHILFRKLICLCLSQEKLAVLIWSGLLKGVKTIENLHQLTRWFIYSILLTRFSSHFFDNLTGGGT